MSARRVFALAVFLGALLMPVGTAFALPPNADEVSTALDGGGGLSVAAVVISVGVTSIGLLLLARFLHAAVDAA